MEVKAIIIDDEENNIDNLQRILQQHCPQIEVMAAANNAVKGSSIILQHQPDIVFLDIEMPVQNGFELLRELPEHNFEIIFVTAHEQYGIQAVRFAAIDYLLKPINVEDLKAAVAKAVQKRVHKKRNLQLENLLAILQNQQPKSEHRIALPTAREQDLQKRKRSSVVNLQIITPHFILQQERSSLFRNQFTNMKTSWPIIILYVATSRI